MGSVHHFRRAPRRQHTGESWGRAARGLGPVLFALPLAAFTAVYVAGDRIAAEASTPAGAGADTHRQYFARCEGPVRTTCVVDGDTIWLEGEKIRIADIDTPEISSPSCAAEARLGERATARLTQLLNTAAFAVQPNPGGRATDRFGRKLRVLSRGGESIGQVLVSEGLAHEWGGAKRGWCG